jgi:cell shape-determining protein MreC
MGRLVSAQRRVAYLQTTLATRNKIIATQEETIRKTQQTIGEQEIRLRDQLKKINGLENEITVLKQPK